MSSRFLSFTFFCAVTVCSPLFAQERDRWLLGTGITYCTFIQSPGLNANVTFRPFGNFHVGPDFSALLTTERKEDGRLVKRKELEYNFNGQYLISLGRQLAIYPLVGANMSRVVTHREGEEALIRRIVAANLGSGLELAFSKWHFFLECKYTTRLVKYDFTTGVLIGL
jgi:hypothetical protein